MNRPYRIDASGRLHFVSQRRTDSTPTDRRDIAGLVAWALISVAIWIALMARAVWV